VVEVTPRRWPAADREPAVLLTNLDQVPHPIGDPVSGDRVRVDARDPAIAIRVIDVRGFAVRTASLSRRRRGSRQDGPQSGSQLRRRVQATRGRVPDRSPGLPARRGTAATTSWHLDERWAMRSQGRPAAWLARPPPRPRQAAPAPPARPAPRPRRPPRTPAPDRGLTQAVRLSGGPWSV
jgi:hypothetical protein